MLAKPKIVRIFLVLVVVSLLLGACGGGDSGKTWFNLPSVALRVNADGNASLWGFNLGPVLQTSLIQQLQGADIQKLELRIGYNGVHLYVNGNDLPYISWDQTSVETLQVVLETLPTVPNGAQIAQALPWLRTIGLGAALYIAPPSGTAALDIPSWTGETTVTPDTVAEPTIGPITIGAIVFDPDGNAVIEGMPLSTLEQLTGSSLPLRLDANTLALLESLGLESILIMTQPNGIDLFMNQNPLPGLAYDTASLEQTATLAAAFVTDPAQLATIDQVLTILPGAEIQVGVSFTGEPIVETDLGTIRFAVTADGTIVLAGIPVAANAIPRRLSATFRKPMYSSWTLT
ncbi:MAG: hypothetical protein HC802_08640 [Caldilineaceae bacterium]|nr:hypothetical protein [Caldilineaceae bacterium]